MLCVCSTGLSDFLCPLLRPHHFVVAGIVCYTCLSVHTFLCKSITVERRVLNRAASQQISARQKQSAASERRSRHDDVRRRSVAASSLEFLRLDDDRWQRLSSGLVAQLAATFGVSASTQTPSRLNRIVEGRQSKSARQVICSQKCYTTRTHCTMLVGRSDRSSTVHSYIPDTHSSRTFQ